VPFEDIGLRVGASLEGLFNDPSLTIGNNPQLLFDLESSKVTEFLKIRFNADFPLQFTDKSTLVQVEKIFIVPTERTGMELQVSLHNPNEYQLELEYALPVPFSVDFQCPEEFNSLSFQEIGLFDIEGKNRGEISGVSEIHVSGFKGTKTGILSNRPMTVWYNPLFTSLLIEGKPTHVFQGVELFFVNNFRLSPGETLHCSLIFKDLPSGDCPVENSGG